MNKKNRISIVGAALVAVLASAADVSAQPTPQQQALATNSGALAGVSNAIPAADTFLTTVQKYFTSFDTNSATFKKASEIDVMVSADTKDGVTSAGLGLNYSLWKFVGVEGTVRNAGIGGVVVSAQGGLSVSRVIYDVKASFYVDGGYSFQLNTPYVESGVRVLKALSPNTAAGVGTYLQADGKGLRGGAGISLFTVITF